METHPIFYVGRSKRYVDSQEITYPDGSNVSNHVDDHGTNDGAVEGKASMGHYQPMSDPRPSSDLRREEDSAPNARLSSTFAPEGRPGSSTGRTLDEHS